MVSLVEIGEQRFAAAPNVTNDFSSERKLATRNRSPTKDRNRRIGDLGQRCPLVTDRMSALRQAMKGRGRRLWVACGSGPDAAVGEWPLYALSASPSCSARWPIQSKYLRTARLSPMSSVHRQTMNDGDPSHHAYLQAGQSRISTRPASTNVPANSPWRSRPSPNHRLPISTTKITEHSRSAATIAMGALVMAHSMVA